MNKFVIRPEQVCDKTRTSLHVDDIMFVYTNKCENGTRTHRCMFVDSCENVCVHTWARDYG